ncbi:hypothetical protein GOD78_10975 [Sinorhizobium medicae]|nr:hypothetical protein [Sinorhizobium medicae]MDX0818040.1 hypothetical protein [Sinorhizobium medicae]
MTSAQTTPATASAIHDLECLDTGVTLTFPDAFAMSAAIIETLRELSDAERAETIGDMTFFATFIRATPEEARAHHRFWKTLAKLFSYETEHPNAERGDAAWHEARHLERMAAAHLDSAGVRELHLPGCATFTTVH